MPVLVNPSTDTGAKNPSPFYQFRGVHVIFRFLRKITGAEDKGYKNGLYGLYGRSGRRRPAGAGGRPKCLAEVRDFVTEAFSAEFCLNEIDGIDDSDYNSVK